jgi:hypothetical protein
MENIFGILKVCHILINRFYFCCIYTANVQQPNGMTVTVPIEEIVSHSAAETLSSLSAAGNTQAVISNEVAQLISQDGTIIQIPNFNFLVEGV